MLTSITFASNCRCTDAASAAITVVVLGHWTIVAVAPDGIQPHGVLDNVAIPDTACDNTAAGAAPARGGPRRGGGGARAKAARRRLYGNEQRIRSLGACKRTTAHNATGAARTRALSEAARLETSFQIGV